MKKVNYFDTLVINEENNFISLCHSSDIYEVVYGSDLSDVVCINDEGHADGCLPETMYEDDFEQAYEEDEAGKFEFVDERDAWDDDAEPKKYSKVSFDDYDHYKELHSEHGINTSVYDVTDAEIISVDVYRADGCTPQEYPNQEYEDCFKVVSKEDGGVYYIKRTSPFFSDDQDDTFEAVDEETYNEFEE